MSRERKKKTKETKIEFNSLEERKAHLEKIIKEINKKNETQSLMYASSLKLTERASTGIEELDNFIGQGFPYGNFSVVWGPKGCGKSTLAYYITASAQKQKKIVVYIDLEHKFDFEWAEKFGVNLDELVLMADIENAEQAMEAIRVLSKNKVVDVIILDSIQGMAPRGEKETKTGADKELDKDTIALLARQMSKFFKVVSNDVAKGNVAVILIGQARVGGIGSFYVRDVLSGGRCFPLDTRILTKDGLKYYNEIKIGDLIPTVNLQRNCIEMQPIQQIHLFNIDQKIIKFKNSTKEFIFTPEHKCLVKMFKNKLKGLSKTEHTVVKAKDSRRTFAFPVCFPSGNEDYPISDTNLKAIAWMLTDSSIDVANPKANNWRKHSNRICIYQTKYWNRIKQIFEASDFEFSMSKRIRKSERKAFKNTKPSYEFYVSGAKKIINKYRLTSDKQLPNWLFKLSDKQAKSFMNEIILADGSFINNTSNYRKLHKGNLKWLEKIATFCVTHNIPIAHIKKDKNKKCWRLNFRQSNYIGFKKENQSKIFYRGKVWDITVPNEYHFIERNGQIIVTHNSIEHWARIILKMRHGQGVDAPKTRIKEGDKTKEIKLGFNCVIEIEKTQIKSSPEGKELHIPFYYTTGFTKPNEEKKRKTENRKTGEPDNNS